jgi:hypothetical protein
MNLKESIRQWVLRNLPHTPEDLERIAYLNNLEARDLLIVFHNWMKRHVKPQPRQIKKSKAFEQNPIVVQRTSDFVKIIDDIEQGRDLKKYLSRDVIRNPVLVPGTNRRRPDLDLMLNDWGIHHLHISTQVEHDGFVRRDGPLLFAVFKPQAAYLIDVMDHASWTRDHVLEVLVSEWPEDGVIHEINEGIVRENPITESQRTVLRSNHCNAFFTFEEKMFIPDGGMATSGYSIKAVREADRLLDRIEAFERDFIQNPERLKSDFERHGVLFPDMPEFEFAIRDDGYGIIETKSQAWINLNDG